MGVTLIVYGLLLLGILATVAGLAYYADTHWETSAGVSAGKAEARTYYEAQLAQQREKDAAAAREASAALEVKGEKRKVVFRTVYQDVEKIVTQYVDRPCLDDAGLRAVNAAVGRKVGAAAEPDDSLPSASVAGRWNGGNRASLDYRDDGGLLGVR